MRVLAKKSSLYQRDKTTFSRSLYREIFKVTIVSFVVLRFSLYHELTIKQNEIIHISSEFCILNSIIQS